MDLLYGLVALLLTAFALQTWRDSEHPQPAASGAFWLILAALFGLGSWMPGWLAGLLVLLLVTLDGTGRVVPSRAPAPPPPDHPRALLLLPVLVIPVFTVAASLLGRALNWDLSRSAFWGLALGALAGLALAMRVCGSRLEGALQSGRRLNETLGAVSLLPQLLASLGAVFATAGVGQWLAEGVRGVLPGGNLGAVVLANCLGMTLVAALTGNSFAAFPVIAQGILVPLLLQPSGADAAAFAILTLAIGASGTLISPMAANFNLVPAALLDLEDPQAVLRFQRPLALALWLLLTFSLFLLLPQKG